MDNSTSDVAQTAPFESPENTMANRAKIIAYVPNLCLAGKSTMVILKTSCTKTITRIRIEGTFLLLNAWAPLRLVCESKGTLCFMLNHRVSKGVSQSLSIGIIILFVPV